MHHAKPHDAMGLNSDLPNNNNNNNNNNNLILLEIKLMLN